MHSTLRLGLSLALLLASVLTGCRGPIDSAAQARLEQGFGTETVTVFPAHVNRAGFEAWDARAAERLAELCNAEHWFAARVSAVEVPLPVEWSWNQAAMLEDGAEAFAAWVREHPLETRYALIADYLLGPKEAGGVHVIVVDAEGRVADVSLWNSHWDTFEELAPKSVDDCTEIAVRGLRENWAELRARAQAARE